MSEIGVAGNFPANPNTDAAANWTSGPAASAVPVREQQHGLGLSKGRPRRSRYQGALPALLALLAIYLATNLLLPGLVSGGWNLYAVQPLLWGCFAIWCVYQMGTASLRVPAVMLRLGLACGAFHVAMLALAGLLSGFGYSSYAHGPMQLTGNLFYLATLLIGIEIARSFLLARFPGSPALSFFAIALLFAALSLSLDQLTALTEANRGTFAVAGQHLLPALSTSFLATMLSSLGGPWAAIAYRGVLLGAEWFSPILPSLPWLATAAAGSLAPAVGLSLIRPQDAADAPVKLAASRLDSRYIEQSDAADAPGKLAASRRHCRYFRKSGNPPTTNRRFNISLTLLLPFALALTAAIWFNTGLLGVQPAIVSGISMEPNLEVGDIVVTRNVDAASIKPGDVIRFQRGEIDVLHRVVEVRQSAAGPVFITQGDNNNYLDPPVPAAALDGKVVLVLPKLGLIPVTIKTWLAR